MATINLRQIARATNGQVHGDDTFVVTALCSLESATQNALTYYMPPQPPRKLQTTAAGAVLLKTEHAPLFPRHKIIVPDPYLAYARVSTLFLTAKKPTPNPIHPTAIISPTATIGKNARIGAYSVIGDHTKIAQNATIGAHVSIADTCTIGAHSTLNDGVRLYSRTRIGARCTLESGVVIGSSGFGYAKSHEPNGAWVRIEQLGAVHIGDDVDIGACTTVDRAALDNTTIGDGVKLDNHIQIAHNVQVGEHTIMAAGVAVAGSAIIGKRCRIGGRVGILGHLQIADDVRVNADSVVAKSIPQAGVYSSTIAARPVAQWRKTLARLHRLDHLAEQLTQLRKQTKPRTNPK